MTSSDPRVLIPLIDDIAVAIGRWGDAAETGSAAVGGAIRHVAEQVEQLQARIVAREGEVEVVRQEALRAMDEANGAYHDAVAVSARADAARAEAASALSGAQAAEGLWRGQLASAESRVSTARDQVQHWTSMESAAAAELSRAEQRLSNAQYQARSVNHADPNERQRQQAAADAAVNAAREAVRHAEGTLAHARGQLYSARHELEQAERHRDHCARTFALAQQAVGVAAAASSAAEAGIQKARSALRSSADARSHAGDGERAAQRADAAIRIMLEEGGIARTRQEGAQTEMTAAERSGDDARDVAHASRTALRRAIEQMEAFDRPTRLGEG